MVAFLTVVREEGEGRSWEKKNSGVQESETEYRIQNTEAQLPKA
jgi:hypothetical protein